MERAQDSELRALILPPLCPPFGLDYVLGIFVHHIFSGEIEIIGPILQTCFEEKKHPVYGGASVAGAVINVVCNCLKKKFSPCSPCLLPLRQQESNPPILGDPEFPECAWMALEAILRLQSWGLEVQAPVTSKLEHMGQWNESEGLSPAFSQTTVLLSLLLERLLISSGSLHFLTGKMGLDEVLYSIQ